jgi:prepilin-type N-terminal cleavage/methylation domain-containing protein
MTVQKTNKVQRGFTLIELLVVIGILAILLAITLIAINPARQFGQANDTKRRSDATEILNAIGQYTASNGGNLPAAIQSASAGATIQIDSTNFPTGATGLCNQLVPTFISALPVDPDASVTNTTPNSTSGITDCTVAWNTGYTVTKDASNRITVAAPHAYSGSISVTR